MLRKPLSLTVDLQGNAVGVMAHTPVARNNSRVTYQIRSARTGEDTVKGVGA